MAILVALCMLALAFVARPAEQAEATGADESQFVAQINALRQSKGRSTLIVNNELVSASRVWAQDMANAGQISHAPDITVGITAPWQKVGENVGVGGTVPSLMDAFIASPTHYDNLVDPVFTHVGVGVVWKGSIMYTTHRFMAWPGGVPTTTTTTTTTTAPPTTTTTAPPTTTTTTRPTTTTTARPTTTTTTTRPTTTTTTARPTTTTTVATPTSTSSTTAPTTTTTAAPTTTTSTSGSGFATPTTQQSTTTSTTSSGVIIVTTPTSAAPSTPASTTTSTQSLFSSATSQIVTPTTINSAAANPVRTVDIETALPTTSIPDQLAFTDDLSEVDDSLVVNEEMVRARVRLLLNMLVRVE